MVKERFLAGGSKCAFIVINLTLAGSQILFEMTIGSIDISLKDNGFHIMDSGSPSCELSHQSPKLLIPIGNGELANLGVHDM